MPLWHGLVQLLQLAAKGKDYNNDDKVMPTKQRWQSDVDNEGDNGNGGDGNGDGDSNDAATAANGNNVDDNDGSI
jgi:hypothetical protein